MLTPRRRPGNAPFRAHVDSVIGRYRVFESLGAGGVGEVFRAWDSELGRNVALKVLHRARGPRGPGLTRAGAARLLREARVAATLHHPNAIVVFDAGEHGDVAYLVMELVRGRTLRAAISDPTVTLERAVGWLLDVARALAAAHDKGIVHQDVKPENVMIRNDGVIKVLDFGLARRLADVAEPGGPPGSPRSDGIYGTPAYVAPERVDGHEGDGLADQFSWGVVAYELLVGRHPWDDDGSKTDAVARIRARPAPPSPSERRPEIPKAVSKVVLRAMSRRPADRFASMNEVIAAMARGWSATSPWPLRAIAAVREPWRRRAVAVAASIAVAGTAWIATSRRAVTARTHAALPATSKAAPPDFGSTISTDPEAAAAYRAGVAAVRSAATSEAERHLARAIARDPSFAAAHLRAALAAPRATDAARDHLERAGRGRTDLGDHDRALLHAFEPWLGAAAAAPDRRGARDAGEPRDLRDRGDGDEVERRLASLAAARPDADVLYHLCKARLAVGRYAGAVDACRAARALDPAMASASWLEAEALRGAGDAAAALSALDACLRASPAASSCLRGVVEVRGQSGACAIAAGAARSLAALEPDDPAPLFDLGSALLASDPGSAEARDVLEGAVARLPAERRAGARARIQANVAAMRGDFDGARRALDAWDEAAGDGDDGEALLARARLDRETGREADLARRLRARDTRRGSAPPADVDRSVVALVASYRAGAMSRRDFDAARAAWWTGAPAPAAGDARTSSVRRWTTAYAYAATTPEDAEDALALLPEPPPDADRDASFDEPVGALLLLAGRSDEAIRFLRRAASSCRAAVHPFESTWAELQLGSALEALDAPAACTAYRVVLERWGGAPESASSARAAERRRTIRCD